jgi:hypothetical protein
VTTTGSITPSFKNSRRFTPWLERAILAAGVWFALLVFALSARAEPTEITAMRADRTADGVVLSAQIALELPGPVDDALGKGIPLFFVAEATLLRERWYWYDKEIATATRHMRLSFQPLTRRWRLVVSSGPIGQAGLALGQTFDTREEAMAAVQRISGWRVIESSEFDPEPRHYINLRFRLDVSQLPRPFQLGVAGQSDWNLIATRSVRIATEAAGR